MIEIVQVSSLLRRFAELRKPCLVACASLAVLVGSVRLTDDAIANGETRTLALHHAHTGEDILITFRESGRYVPEALKKLNWFLRDWRKDEPTNMDPELFDLVWEVYREVGAQEPIVVVSAFRSAGTNAMLRSRSRAVAKHSQHIQGRAMDMHFPGINMARVREVGMLLQRGGVGFYPTAGTPFVHLDTGSVRHWPRMSRDQLARLFPDGNTVHIPADGKPMGGYDVAYAAVTKRGGRVGGFGGEEDESDYTSGRDGSLVMPRSKGGGFLAALFGGGRDEQPPPPRLRRGAPPPVAVASAEPPAPPPALAAVPAPVQTAFADPSDGRRGAVPPPAPGTLGAQALGLQQAGAAAMAMAFAPVPTARPRGVDPIQTASIEPLPVPAARPKPDLPPLIAFGTPEAKPQQPQPAAVLAYAETGRPAAVLTATTPANAPLPAMRPSMTVHTAPLPGARPSALVAPRTASSAPGRALIQNSDKPLARVAVASTLAKPDPRAATAEMTGKPLAVAFQANPGSVVPSDRFTGHAVTALATTTFTR